MPDFKPFCLADNMARSAIGGDFRFPSYNIGADTKKPGRAAATGLSENRRNRDPVCVAGDQPAVTISDSNGL
jgi:hypothetical protein